MASHSSGGTWMTQNHRVVRTRLSNGSLVYSNPQIESVGRIDLSTAVGIDTPNFHKLVREGQLVPFTPWESVIFDASQQGHWDVNDGTYRDVVIDDIYGDSWFWTFPDGLAAIKSELAKHNTDYFVQAAAAAIYSSGWDVLTWLVELRKLLDLFQDILKRLRKGCSGKNFARCFEDAWLENRYALRTTWYDIQDFLEAMQNDQARRRFSEHVGTTFTLAGGEITTPSAGVIGSMNVSYSWSLDIGLRGTVAADIVPPTFAANPVVTGWEVIPFSFIVDWFLGVGQALEALSFLALVKKYTACAGLYGHYTYSRTVTPLNWTPPYNGSYACQQTYSCIYKQRVPVSISGIPQWKLRLDADKFRDILALLRLK